MRWTTGQQEEAAVGIILLGLLLLVLFALFSCRTPTAPGYQSFGVRCTLTQANDSTYVDSCR